MPKSKTLFPAVDTPVSHGTMAASHARRRSAFKRLTIVISFAGFRTPLSAALLPSDHDAPYKIFSFNATHMIAESLFDQGPIS